MGDGYIHRPFREDLNLISTFGRDDDLNPPVLESVGF